MKKFSFLMYLQFPGIIELPLQRLPFSLIEGTKNIFLVELSFRYSLFFLQISMDFCVGFFFFYLFYIFLLQTDFLVIADVL